MSKIKAKEISVNELSIYIVEGSKQEKKLIIAQSMKEAVEDYRLIYEEEPENIRLGKEKFDCIEAIENYIEIHGHEKASEC